MIREKECRTRERYAAPRCEEWALLEGQALCETSFEGGEIKPGEGMDWGTF